MGWVEMGCVEMGCVEIASGGCLRYKVRMPDADVQRVAAELNRHHRLLLTAHEKPDGDALGATLGLLRLLRAQGHTAVAGGLAPIPARYLPFVHPGELIGAAEAEVLLSTTDAVVALDAGAAERCPAFVARARGRVPVINIDHHASNTGFGDLDWVDERASSAGEMVWRLAGAAGWPIAPDAAEALWIAIVTDTGRFSYENTTPALLRAAAALLELGVRTAAIDQAVYQSFTVGQLRLQAAAIRSLELCEGGAVAVVGLAREDFLLAGCGPQDAEEIANIPRSIRGVGIGAFLYEIETAPAAGGPTAVQTKVSLRCAEPYDGAAFCGQFGGGGHARAAGCALAARLPEARARFLAAVHATWFARC